MKQLNKETFAKLIKDEYYEWCCYNTESYLLKGEETDEDLWEFVRCNIIIDNSFTIEQLNDEDYNAWKNFYYTINKDEIWKIVEEIIMWKL